MAIQPIAISAEVDDLWQSIREETKQTISEEPIVATFLYATILNHQSLECALSFHLAHKLDSPNASALLVREVIQEALHADPSISKAMRCDLRAIKERDSACDNYSVPFLYFKA